MLQCNTIFIQKLSFHLTDNPSQGTSAIYYNTTSTNREMESRKFEGWFGFLFPFIFWHWDVISNEVAMA
jgi:hypothetical protein